MMLIISISKEVADLVEAQIAVNKVHDIFAVYEGVTLSARCMSAMEPSEPDDNG